jgi:hypothetical protein
MSERKKRIYTDQDLLHAASVLISAALANGVDGNWSTKVLLDDGREFEIAVRPLTTNEVKRFMGIVGRVN